MMPNSFVHINDFIIYCKFVGVFSLQEVFQFCMSDLKKYTSFFHIAPVNRGGDKFFAFISYKDSWSGWKNYFFFTMREQNGASLVSS